MITGSLHDLDRQFLARLRATPLRKLKTLRVTLVRTDAPRWQQVAVARAIARLDEQGATT